MLVPPFSACDVAGKKAVRPVTIPVANKVFRIFIHDHYRFNPRPVKKERPDF